MLDIAEELLLLSWSISSPIFHLSRETPSEASDSSSNLAERGSGGVRWHYGGGAAMCGDGGLSSGRRHRAAAQAASSFKGTYSGNSNLNCK